MTSVYKSMAASQSMLEDFPTAKKVRTNVLLDRISLYKHKIDEVLSAIDLASKNGQFLTNVVMVYKNKEENDFVEAFLLHKGYSIFVDRDSEYRLHTIEIIW